MRLCVCDHWTQSVCACWTHRLRDGKKKSDGGHKEKWRGKDETTVGCVECVYLSRETQVLRSRSWNPGPEVQVLKLRSGRLPRVNTRVFFFFFRPFLAGCPRLIPRFSFFLFFRPFSAGSLCRRRTYPGLIPGFFFSSPFFGGLPRVNTRAFFFFFSRPFLAGRRWRVPISMHLCRIWG